MLEDVTVVEFGANLAGPFCGQILAHLGAEVIKVERPSGDDARQWGPPFVDGASVSFVGMNRGKRSVVVDLDDALQRAALVELIGTADVYVHNARSGVMENHGLGGEALLARFPTLIYAGISAFGRTGPLAHLPGYEPLLQAYSGLISVNGHPDGPGARVGASVVDLGTGMWTTIGILGALHQRVQTGAGCVVDTSLLETALGWMGSHVAAYSATGKLPERQGTGHALLTPYQAFETANGPLMITPGNNRLWGRLCEVLGHAEWISDPRFVDNAARAHHRPLVISMVQDVLRGETREHWMTELSAVGVPCGPINEVDDVLAAEHVKALGIHEPYRDTTTILTGLPVSFDGHRPWSSGPAPALGERPLTAD